MSTATLSDAGFKAITCGTSGSGCFFIANILLIALCCVVILIKRFRKQEAGESKSRARHSLSSLHHNYPQLPGTGKG